MSGQQWGTVIGGVIGAYFGNPQLGAAIGGFIGGAVDPTKVFGPRLSDATQQTAMDGVPRPYGQGTFPCTGNVIWRDPTVKEHKHKDDGKGSGQEQITYTYTRSYAIGVCKGPISGFKQVKRNTKVVFDARTDAELTALGYTSEQIAVTRAAQSKFLQKCTFYYGDQEQMPDPTMVAVKGVGNVPAYRGTAYIVMTDDETNAGEVAQYEFVVANCGERTEDDFFPSRLLVTGTAINSGDPVFVQAEASDDLSFTGIAQSTGADLAACVPGYYASGGVRVWLAAGPNSARVSTDNMASWSTISNDIADVRSVSCGLDGWAVNSTGGQLAQGKMATAPINPTAITYLPVPTPVLNADNSVYVADLHWLQMLRYVPEEDRYYAAFWGNLLYLDEFNGAPCWRRVASPSGFNWILDIIVFEGMRYITVLTDLGREIRRDANENFTFSDVVFTGDGSNVPWQLEKGDGVLACLIYGANRVATSVDGFTVLHDTGIASNKDGSGPQNDFRGRQIAFASGRFFIISGDYTPDPSIGNCCVSTVDGTSFATPASLGLKEARGIAASDGVADGTLTAIPDSPGYYVDSVTGKIIGPSGTQISVCKPTLGEIVAEQCDKRDIATRDVSELTDEVVGFRVASPSSPQKNIASLMPGYFFDSSEFDGVLHFPKRGGEDSFALTMDDLCERDDGDPLQWERTQEPELLRKLTVSYIDPDTTYTVTTQKWERRSGTVKAEGEGTLELPVVGTKDWAAQAADMNGKVAWAESDKCTFHTSIAQAKLVTAAVGTITDEQGTVHRIRIERIEDEGLVRMIEARRTRADVYESSVSGAAKPLPRFPGSNIRGPTDGLLLNLPVIVDSNDVPGIAWAAAGFLGGWVGTVLQIQRAGQWVEAGRTDVGCAMGTLLADLPAHAGDIDTANVLRVRMNEPMESVTFTNLLQERNPLAILYPDGTAEIVQFQTATETSAGEYELTTLLRGRLNTDVGEHAAGARVVFLDTSVKYASLQPTDVGTTLSYRFISMGTDPDAAPVQTLDLTTMESQREWPVFDLQVEQDGDDFILTWRKRDRLGTDVFPIRSTNWRGYEVSYSYGGNTHTETVATESITFTLPGASDITFSVAQVNLYTGAGPAETVHIP